MRSLLTLLPQGVTLYQGRKDYFLRTGQTAPPHDNTRGDQFWCDPTKADLRHVEYTFLNFDPTDGGGSLLENEPFYNDTMSGHDAATPNFPDETPAGVAPPKNPIASIPWPADPTKLAPGEKIQHNLMGYQIMTPADLGQSPTGQAASLEKILEVVTRIDHKIPG